VLVVAPILIIGRQVRRLSRDSQDRLADTSVRASETLGAMTTVQSYVQETLESTRYAGVVEHAFDSAVRRNRRRAILTALVISLVFGSIVFVLWLGAQAVADARMPDPSSQTSSGSTVAFDQVDFSYPSRPNEQALAGVSFEIKPGEN